MATAGLTYDQAWDDLLESLNFAESRLAEFAERRLLTETQWRAVQVAYEKRRKEWQEVRAAGGPLPKESGLHRNPFVESPLQREARYLESLERQVARLTRQGLFTLAQSHAMTANIAGRTAALKRQFSLQSIAFPADVSNASSAADAPNRPSNPESIIKAELVSETKARPVLPTPAAARRNLIEILLDPRSIQGLLALGGALMVVGLVLWLWVNEYFTSPIVALVLGVANAGVLLGGWAVLTKTRYHLAGRALTLLACFVMPLNLWYYHANNLMTLEGHLWVAAVLISALYAASAWVLRDEVFVYVFVAGVTMTGLLLLASLTPSPQHFFEIASPATLLVVLALACIHVERAFAEAEGPFSRERFGLAFFWSGQMLLASGLLLILGAQILGDWLYEPLFKHLYDALDARPSPIVGELRWLALALTSAGTYAYLYSDLVVRRRGIYTNIASFTFVWTFLMLIEFLGLATGVDAIIAVLAVTGLIASLLHGKLVAQQGALKNLSWLGILLQLAAVGLGLLMYARAISFDLKSVWQTETPGFGYVGAMLLTAVSCRAGALLYQHTQPRLSVTFHFATAAATMMAVASMLAAMGLETWREHAPILALLPIAYLIAAQFYRGRPAEQALVWVSQAAAAVMIISSLASTVEGTTRLVEGQRLNLVLALFFGEMAFYYGLMASWRRWPIAVHLCAGMAAGAVWQLLTYAGAAAEVYTLVFAIAGLALLLCYRFAVGERFGPAMANALFESANTLLSITFIAAAMMGLSRLLTREIQWGYVGLCLILATISLVAVVLVQQAAWRRWYVVTAVGHAVLMSLALAAVSDLTRMQKVEVVSVLAGLVLLTSGHIGWYRERQQENDLATVGMWLGSLMVLVPLALATTVDRGRNDFILLNELGFLAAAVLLLSSGFVLQLKSTAMTGAFFTFVYFATLLIFVPWSRLNAVAVMVAGGGALVFGAGLVLSLFRDRLLALPDRIKRREGLFRVLNWR
jgi:hypothetical protein